MTDDDVAALMPVAAELSCAVTDYDPVAVAEILTSLDTEKLYALATLLAAHVDVDYPLDAQREVKRIRRIAVAGASRSLSVPEHKILSRAQDRQSARARSVAMAVAHRAGVPVVAVGRMFDRDHSTVKHALKSVDNDQVLSAMADHIGDRLTLAVIAG